MSRSYENGARFLILGGFAARLQFYALRGRLAAPWSDELPAAARRPRPVSWWSFSTPCGSAWFDYAALSSGIATSSMGSVRSFMEASLK
jgi:hypothetical protein